MLTTTRPEASRTARSTYAQLAGMLPCRSLTQAYVTGALYAFDPTGRSVTFEGAGLVPGSPITITERYRTARNRPTASSRCWTLARSSQATTRCVPREWTA